MGGENWEELYENRKWENRDSRRFLCNLWKRLKNADDNDDITIH